MMLSIISLVALFYGSYTDIKTREIPDTLSLGLIYLGVAIALGASILFWSYKPLLGSMIGLCVGAAVGLLFYYTGQWGGGDAKMLMGLGSVMGVDVFAISSVALLPEFAVFIINIFLFGAIYGVFYILFLAVKNWRLFRAEFREVRRKSNVLRLRLIFISLIILFSIFALIFKPNFVIIAATYLLLLFVVISLYLFMIIKTVEKTCLLKSVDVKKLTEGDWVLDKVKLKDADKYIYTKTGITEKGIKMLLKSGKKKVLVKEGIPFVPSFLVAYIMLLFFGNWLAFFHF